MCSGRRNLRSERIICVRKINLKSERMVGFQKVRYLEGDVGEGGEEKNLNWEIGVWFEK